MTQNAVTLEQEVKLSDRLEVATNQTGFLHSLQKQLDLTQEEFEELKDQVFIQFQSFVKDHPEIKGEALRSAFAQELICASARKSAIVGAATSIPITLPFVGALLPFMLRLGILFSFTARVQLELIFSLAALYDYPWKGKELSSIGFVLIGLSDYEDVKSYAAKMGVKLTVKKFVGKLAGLITLELASSVSSAMMTSMMGNSIAPLTYGPGAVLGAFFSYDSTKAVGKRAFYFFSDEEEKA